MFARSLILALSLAAPAAAYTKKDREDAIKWITEEKGFPHLAAFDNMTPKMLKTVMTNYLNLVSPDALEFLTPLDLEVIWTATSAANNCEICLSFHAGALLGAEKPADEVATMAAGGVPKDPKMARLVMAAKYVLAHKGILLEREKLHLSSMGFSAEELVEVTFAVGQMAGLNLLYVAPRPRSFFAIDASLTQVRPPHQRGRRDRDLPQGRGPVQGHGLRGRAQEGRALIISSFLYHLPQVNITIIRSSPAGYSGSRSASSAATASPWTKSTSAVWMVIPKQET